MLPIVDGAHQPEGLKCTPKQCYDSLSPAIQVLICCVCTHTGYPKRCFIEQECTSRILLLLNSSGAVIFHAETMADMSLGGLY